MTCPLCGGAAERVLYAGLPARLCAADRCRCLFGGAAWLIGRLPFNGMFMVFEGSYLRALWAWVRGRV